MARQDIDNYDNCITSISELSIGIIPKKGAIIKGIIHNYDENSEVSWKNRAQGLTAIALAGIFSTALSKNSFLLSVGTLIFAIDGIGDLITGKHHYYYVKSYNFLLNKFIKPD